MDFKELWNDYVSEDITEISEEVIEVFKKKFSNDIYEEYDVGELLTEFTGHHETANKYDKIEAFGSAIKEYHPNLYHEDGGYINEALIKYYCFRKEDEKLKDQVIDFISGNYDYDLLLKSVDQLLYNGYSEILNIIIEKEYEKVKNDEELLPGAEFRLAVIKFYYELEKIYKESGEQGDIDWREFLEGVKKYELEVTVNELSLNYLTISPSSEEYLELMNKLSKKLPADREQVLMKLGRLFMRRMLSKNCSFAVSSYLWQNICEYFEKSNSNSWKGYFKFNKESFRKYLRSKSGFFTDERINVFLFIWGSEYIIDFLSSIGIYQTEEEYKAQQRIIDELKIEFKEHRKHYLWEYNFVHRWKTSKEEKQNNWRLEEAEFEASYELEIKKEKFDDLNFKQLFGNTFNEAPRKSNPKIKLVPVRTERKIGRNEKVTVQYNDGTIKKDIKYKKVIKDLEDGVCELI